MNNKNCAKVLNLKIISILIFLGVNIDSFSQNFSQDKFNDFWSETINELDSYKLTIDTIRIDTLQSKICYILKINSYNNINFHMYISEPIIDGYFVTKIKFSPFGKRDYTFEEVIKDKFMSEKDVICIKVDNRGQGMSRDIISNDRFLLNGIAYKETYVYRGVFMDVYRSVNVSYKNCKSNGILIATGTSQGGLLALVATSLNTKINLCIANIPFYSDIRNNDVNRWPMNWILPTAKSRDLTIEQQLSVLDYYDSKNFASNIKAPTFITVGSDDYITPKEGILKTYSNIAVEDKCFYEVFSKGHGFNSPLSEKLQKVFIEYHLSKLVIDTQL